MREIKIILIILFLMVLMVGCSKDYETNHFKRDKHSGYVIVLDAPCFDWPYEDGDVMRDATIHEMTKEDPSIIIVNLTAEMLNQWCEDHYGYKIKK